jgi:hypothetical protein
MIMTVSQSPKIDESPSRVRKTYGPPRLVRFGSMRELTASGSVNKNENTGHPTGRL